MKAAELCIREVIVASRETSIVDAARLMREHHIGCLVITDDIAGHPSPVGILTDRDIVIEVIAKDIPLNDVTVGDVMTFALLKVSEDEELFDVAQRMRARGVRRVPVITADTGALAGIIAMDDILSLLSQELSLLSTLTSREAEQEARKRPRG
ncbi:MAG: CBS domain-containing protein [Gammaproteobacteria bacterium]|nr:CBS domain-containing protein [Gammaproteobacteria bacterium]